MQGEICPYCHEESYSAVTTTGIWTCPYCQREFMALEDRKQGEAVGETKGEREGDR